MSKIIGKEALCSTDLKYFKAFQGINGKTLFDRYPALDNVVKGNIDAKYQDFLSQPIKHENTITFHGKYYSETPHLLSELSEIDQAKYTTIKDDTISHFRERINSLRNSGKITEATFLSDAIKYIDDRFLYCYDDKVVLGVWGMQLRDNVREDIGVIRKNLFKKKKKEKEVEENVNPALPEPSSFIPKYNIQFKPGEHGRLSGNSFFEKDKHSFVDQSEIPEIQAENGYEFVGWSDDPVNHEVNDHKEFVAQYKFIQQKSIVPGPLPWYTRFWNWLRALFLESGCLKWLLWLLLLLLLIWLLGCLLCNRSASSVVAGGALSDRDSAWLREDPNVGHDGGIYDPNNPYTPLPTPPGYDSVLPPYQGVLPPINQNPDTIPGNPVIFANRLNILMENENKSILDLARAFKQRYPDDKYKIVYYDDVVKRMQIEIPKEERERLKEEIPRVFAPEFELFVFDEALFEGGQASNDPLLSDNDKAWYLNAIKAPQAWSITRGSEKISIAIVDNGFNLTHPELASKVTAPYNVWTHSGQIFPQQVDHGTHVAGIALAIANNGKGGVGIAPNCKFMPVQVADRNGMMTTTSVLDGILYSLYQGADVINVSLGGNFSGISNLNENAQKDLINNHFKEEERLWRRVMRIAATHNATVVIAAGNDNILAGIDALQRPDQFISVSATDKTNRNPNKAEFSNYGTYATISAPGVGIYSTVGKDNYATMDGTSMAAPIVSGVVALMKSVNDSITTKQIICILQNTGLETQGNVGKLIQADKAVQKAKIRERVDCTPVPSTGDVQILLSWNNYNDLDLMCTDPKGETISFQNPGVSSGGKLQIDMNVEYPHSKNPIENIYWPSGTAPAGTYNVYLNYFKNHESTINETPYNIKVKYGTKTEEYKGIIRKDNKVIRISTFTLAASGSRSRIQNVTTAYK